MNYFLNPLLLLLPTLIYCISNDTSPITTYSIMTPNSHRVWFAQTQVFVYQLSNSPPYNVSEFLHHYTVNTTNQSNTFNFSSKYWIYMQMAKMPLTSDYMIGSINLNNQLIFYRISNNSLTEWYNPNVTASRVVFDEQVTHYAFSMNSTTRQLLKINLRSKTVQQNIDISSSLYQLQQIAYDGGIVAGYSQILINNFIHFYFYNVSRNSAHLITIPWSVQPPLKSFQFSSDNNILVVTDTHQVQIWDIQNYSIMATILNNVTVMWGFEDAVICNGFLFIFSNKFLNVYELDTLVLFQSIDLMDIYWVSMAKCFPNQNKVAAYFDKTNQRLVKYFAFNYTNYTSSIITNNSNNTSPATVINNTSTTTNGNINQGNSQNSSPTNAGQLQNIAHSIRSAVISPQAKVIGGITSSVAGLTSAAAILKPIMQPFTCFIEDLWFYGFHQFTYPEFVQLFTKEIDILNQLRIKPEFIQLQIQFSNLESLNAKQADMKLLQDKAPDSQLMLQATQDIYTINLATSLVSFVVMKLICVLLKSTRHFCQIIEKAYHFLSPICKWWSLFIAFFESNITPIVFYASLQFNSFVYFDQFSKFNLVITLLMSFTVLAYAFLFYPLLFQFASRKERKKVSDFGKGAHHSYWLEMCLKCLRSYFQSLIHGLFINHNILQLLGLIISDLSFVIAITRLRKMFESKAVFFLTAFYFAFFLVFDITLITYRLLSSLQLSETQRREQKIYFEFVTMIVIIFLLAFSIIKVLIPIFSLIYDNIAQRLKRNNLIADQNAKKLKRKNIKNKLKSQNNISLKKKKQDQKQQQQKKDNVNAKITKSVTKIKNHCKRTRIGMQVVWTGSKVEDKNYVVSQIG